MKLPGLRRSSLSRILLFSRRAASNLTIIRFSKIFGYTLYNPHVEHSGGRTTIVTSKNVVYRWKSAVYGH